MKTVDRLVACCLLLICGLYSCAPSKVEAWPVIPGIYGDSVPFPTAPILHDVTVNFGEYTASGMGGVRLSSMDNSSGYAVTIYGLGLQDPSAPPCANWTTTQTGGTSTHFNKYTGAEGTTARTPTPTSTGVTAHLNGGPYTFSVSCTDADGDASNTATVSYTIIDDAANIDEYSGNFPAVTSGYANFASTAGYKLLISTGFKKATSLAPSIRCPVECLLTWADTAKPGLITRFQPVSTQDTKIRLKDMVFTGDATGTAMVFGNPTFSTNTLALENVGCRYTPSVGTNYLPGCLDTQWAGAPGNNITDFYAEWVGLGLRIQADGYNLRNIAVKNFNINAMDMNVADNLTMYDWLFWNPQVGVGGYHADCWQVTNGSSNKNFDIQRGACVTAGGYGPTQGPIFPGHSTRARGYISNGSGGAGLIVTLTGTVHDPNAFFDEGVDGSQIIASGCITAADNARVASSSSPGTAVLTGIAPLLCGSAGSPVDIYTYTMENFNAQGIIHSGYGFSGWGQNSAHGTGGIQNFAYVHQTPQPTYATSGIGTIVGNQLTVIGPTTSNATDTNASYNAGINWGSSEPYGITYPGLVGSPLTATSKTSNGSSTNCNQPSDVGKTCVYTLNRSPGNVTGVTITAVPPVGTTSATQAPQISFGETATAALYTGTGQTVKDGFAGAGLLFPLGGGSYGPPPSNMTVTNVWDVNTAPPATAFANGNPTTTLQAISIATWNAMSRDEVLAAYCHALLPEIGGPLDNGDGTFASPFKLVAGQGQWWDGTVITGCN